MNVSAGLGASSLKHGRHKIRVTMSQNSCMIGRTICLKNGGDTQKLVHSKYFVTLMIISFRADHS